MTQDTTQSPKEGEGGKTVLREYPSQKPGEMEGSGGGTLGDKARGCPAEDQEGWLGICEASAPGQVFTQPYGQKEKEGWEGECGW